jgi:quercetin dioxygenase-like cupin family protein
MVYGSRDPDDWDNRENLTMLTRRRFAGFASCAICAVSGFIATEASAQGTPPLTVGTVTRTTLTQVDGPTPGYTTINVLTEMDPNAALLRHTHPGVESAYIVEGGVELQVKGQAAQTLKAGDGWAVPAETPHALKNGDKKTKYAITFIVEKGKPLASPAPE